jgi:murein DD-endopeptidase MepM/ murein hydrolase activator NlpD
MFKTMTCFIMLLLLSEHFGLAVASPNIDYGNIDGINEGTDACDPNDVYGKVKQEKLLIAPVDLRVRGIAVRVPYRAEDNRNIGTHGMTRNNGTKFHAGTDLIGDEGESVAAVSSGTILAVGFQDHLGNYIILRSDVVIPPALPCAVDFVYAHLRSIDVVAGKKVNAGSKIATMGRTGNLSAETPTHLHIEFWAAPYTLGLDARKKHTRDMMELFNPLN